MDIIDVADVFPSSATTTATTKSMRQRPSLSLSYVFAIQTVFLVLVACGLVWYLGYGATLATSNALTNHIRTILIHDITKDLNDQLFEVIEASSDLKRATFERWPHFSLLSTVTTDQGFLADLSYEAVRYPSINYAGFMNEKGVFLAFTKAPAISQTNLFSVLVAEYATATTTITTITNASTSSLAMFMPTPIRNSSSQLLNLHADIISSDSINDTARYLGPARSIALNFSAAEIPFWSAVVELKSQVGHVHRNGGWSDLFVVPDLPGSPGFVGISALSMLNSADGVAAAFAVVSLEELNAHLASLSFGAHGSAHLFTASGHIIASSDVTLQSQCSTSSSLQPQGIDSTHSTHPVIAVVRPLLLAWKLISTQPLTLRNASLVLPKTSEIFEVDRTIASARCRVQASMLSDMMGPFTVVIITEDNDFNGPLRKNLVTTAWSSTLACLGAILVSLLVTRVLSRPILKISAFIDRADIVIAMEQGPKQRASLAQLQREWAVDSTVKMSWLKELRLMHRSFDSMLTSLVRSASLDVMNRAKRQFLRFIFHEVRVPFNAIVMGIDQLGRLVPQLPAHAADDATLIMNILYDQSKFVSRLLGDVLCLQQIEDGCLQLEVAPFTLDKLLKTTVDAFRPGCADKHVALEVNLDHLQVVLAAASVGLRGEGGAAATSRFALVGDAFRLRQVVANFLSNAVKFSPDQGVIRVGLKLTAFEPVKDTDADNVGTILLRIAVEDEGDGISADDQLTLFHPYVQVAVGPFHKGHQGTGLGLSICKSIITLHGGYVGVHSVVGEGATFFLEVRLPVRRREGESPVPRAARLRLAQNTVTAMTPPVLRDHDTHTQVADLTTATAAAASSSTTAIAVPSVSSRATNLVDLTGFRILVVEDSLPNLKLLVMLLRQMKCLPTGVMNGKECIDLFPITRQPDQKLDFDLILMDGSMPKMNGVEATRILRARGFTLPIIAITGNALEEDVHVFLEAGASQVLTKPVNRQQLQAALLSYVPVK